jgi:aerobic carbon-monoxide dehydrogenase medium subunit
MSSFEYAAPRSLEEALGILSSRPEAQALAGGQKLLLGRGGNRAKGTVLVDIGQISSLKEITAQSGNVRIGATATLNELAGSEVIARHLPTLSEVAGTIGDAQLRNRATVGGNLAEGDPEYDLPALLLALGATVETEGLNGRRACPADEFFREQHSNSHAAKGLITCVVIPIPASKQSAAYLRIKHPARLTAVCGVAAVITGEWGRIVAARVAVTGATKYPIRLEKVEQNLLMMEFSNGRPATFDVSVLDDSIEFRGDAFASAEYRQHLARILTGRAIRQALDQTAT